jgi:hypothetical protein
MDERTRGPARKVTASQRTAAGEANERDARYAGMGSSWGGIALRPKIRIGPPPAEIKPHLHTG